MGTIGVKYRSGPFKGVATDDAFARAALAQEPVVVPLSTIPWPAGLAPTVVPLGSYKAGETITTALEAQADVLIVLYTDLETQALLEVFTQDSD